MDDKSVWNTEVESFINEYQLDDDITSECDGTWAENNNILHRAGASYVSLMLELFYEESKTVNEEVEKMPKSRVPYPRKSFLTQSNMKQYLNLDEKFRNVQFITDLTQPILRKLYQDYKSLQAKIVEEQEDFQNYLLAVASQYIAEYNFIQNVAKEWIKECMYIASLAVKKYPRFYVSQKEIFLSVVPFTTDVLPAQIGNFVCALGSPKLLKTIKYPLTMSFENLSTELSPQKDVDDDKWKKCNVSEDENAERLAVEWEADIVIAMKALRTLADNPAPFMKEWETPVVVKTVNDNEQKDRTIVFVNSPLPPKSIIAREKNAMYFKALFKSMLGVEVSLSNKFNKEVGNEENKITTEVKFGRNLRKHTDCTSFDMENQHAMQKNADATMKHNSGGKSSSDEFSSSEHDEKKSGHNIKITQKKHGVTPITENLESDVSSEQVDSDIPQVDGASDEIRKSKRGRKPTIKKKDTGLAEQQKCGRKRKAKTPEVKPNQNKKKPGPKRNIHSAKGKKAKAYEDDIQERVTDEIEQLDVDDSDEDPLWTLPKPKMSQGIDIESESDSADERETKKKIIVSRSGDAQTTEKELHAEVNLQTKVPVGFLSLKDSSFSGSTQAAKWKSSLNSWFPKQNESLMRACTSMGDLKFFKPYGSKSSSTHSESENSSGEVKSKEKKQPYELSFSSATLPGGNDTDHSESDNLVIDIAEPEFPDKKNREDEKIGLSDAITQSLEEIISEEAEKPVAKPFTKTTKSITGKKTPLRRSARNYSKRVDQSTDQTDVLSQTIIASHESTQKTLTDITSTPMTNDARTRSKSSVKGSRSVLQVKLLSPVVRTGKAGKKLVGSRSISKDFVETQDAEKKRMGNGKDTRNLLESKNLKDDNTKDEENIPSFQHKIEKSLNTATTESSCDNVQKNTSLKNSVAQNTGQKTIGVPDANPKHKSSDLIGQILSSSTLTGYCKTQNVPLSDSLKTQTASGFQKLSKSSSSDLLGEILGDNRSDERQRKHFDVSDSRREQADHIKREDNAMLQPTVIEELINPCNNINVSYSLWQFGKKRVLIRYSLDGAVRMSSGKQAGVSLRAKTEYQSTYAYEQLTPSEVCQDWLTMLIKPADAHILRGRIDPLKSKLLCMEWLKTREQLTQEATRIGFNPIMTSKLLTTIFEKFSSLDEGIFICSHKSGESKVTVKKSVQDPSKKVVYDLHEEYKCPGRDVICSAVPWVPADPHKPCPFHLACKRIPLTFEPRDESVDRQSTVNKKKSAPGKKKKKSKWKKKANKN